MGQWQPQPESMKILDFAMAKIKSVPYKVSSRWTFYRILQAGLIPDKSFMDKFDYLLSRARKSFYGEWRPDTLVDSIRQADFKGEQYVGFYLELDSIDFQDYYVQLWFEAEAMHQQFEYYTKDFRVSLVPFRGDCSIPIKWQIAKKLEEINRNYNKPIKVLYFGDYDPKGLQILEAALKDIQAWCDAEFDVERVGLTLEQANAMNIPENPGRPNTYQWEALEDEHAKKLILESLSKIQRPLPLELTRHEEVVRVKVHAAIKEILEAGK